MIFNYRCCLLWNRISLLYAIEIKWNQLPRTTGWHDIPIDARSNESMEKRISVAGWKWEHAYVHHRLTFLYQHSSNEEDENHQEKYQDGKYFYHEPPIGWYLIEMPQQSAASSFHIHQGLLHIVVDPACNIEGDHHERVHIVSST